MDWGEPPRYNAAYRKIRWPGVSLRYLGRGIKPDWMRNIRWAESHSNNANLWRPTFTRGILKRDLIFCVSENIPIKTNSIEYRPSDQYLYIKGRPILKYNLETGCFDSFSYSGVYDKVVSLFLRLFDIDVRMINRKLSWRDSYGFKIQDIKLDETYYLPKPLVSTGKILTNPVKVFSPLIIDRISYVELCSAYEKLNPIEEENVLRSIRGIDSTTYFNLNTTITHSGSYVVSGTNTITLTMPTTAEMSRVTFGHIT
jgi:hypothetical protein